MSTKPEEPPKLEQPKDNITEQKRVLSRSNSVDSSILVIDEDVKDVKEAADTTMEDDDLPPALESEVRAGEMEQVPAFAEFSKTEPRRESMVGKPPLSAVPTPSVTVAPNATPIAGPLPANFIPVTKISASAATTALNNLNNANSTTTSNIPSTSASTSPVKKPRAPRKPTKKQQVQQAMPHQIMTPPPGPIFHQGIPMQYMYVNQQGKLILQQPMPRAVQMEQFKNGSPPNNIQRVQYVQQAMPQNKGQMKVQPQYFQMPQGFIAQQQMRPMQQQIQVKAPQQLNGNLGRYADCHPAQHNGRLVMVNSKNEIVGYIVARGDGTEAQTVLAEPPPTLSPNPQASSTSDDKAPPAKKIKMAEAESSPSTSDKGKAQVQKMLNLTPLITMSLSRERINQMCNPVIAKEQVVAEERPPAIEKPLFNVPQPSEAVSKTVFHAEAQKSAEFQPKPSTKLHKIHGFTIAEPTFQTPEKSPKKLQNYVLSPQSSAPSTPSSQNSTFESKTSSIPKKDEKKEQKMPIKEKVIQKPQKEVKPKAKVGRKPKLEITPKVDQKIEKHPSSTPRKIPEHLQKKVKSAGNTPSDKPPKRKNREVEGLLNMDFGPGKNPFKTNSADAFRENILQTQQQYQKHTQAEEPTKINEVRAASRTPSQSRRGRPSNDKKSEKVERPKRSIPNSGYKQLFEDDFEEEENTSESVDEDNRSILSHNSERGCIFCHKVITNKKNPQYCDSTCKRKYRQKAALEGRMNDSSDGAEKDQTGLEHSECSSTSSASRPSSAKPQRVQAPEPVIQKSEGVKAPPVVVQPVQKVAPEPVKPTGLNINNLKETRSVSKWTLEEVAAWAASLGCSEEVINILKDQEIDGDALVVLFQEKQLQTGLSLKLGPTVKIERGLREILQNQKDLNVF
ncbi:unnamed protein product [Bursaphelenchus okinawaensis]|uniref:SAM domain-containing protein n=1 Tax=Bursaphelenchus okinawaensis TaxID=465554 RepID=A0A811K8D6_9BILA|nr:unnamed protein product [Bursaphelenchus okinawaensis]CAG9095859.1 unnamed protein product [Bursaphelenchus okinawaensis]